MVAMMPMLMMLSGAASFAPTTTRSAASLGLRRSPPPFLVEASAETSATSSVEEDTKGIFTLETKNDGWDDVRGVVVRAKKDRSKALEEIKGKYGPPLKTASRWAKVLTEEITGADLSLPTAAPKMAAPKIAVPKVDVPSVDGASIQKAALSQLTAILDVQAARRKAEQEQKQEEAAKIAKKTAAAAQVSPVGAANVGLLLGVPLITLLAILSVTFGGVPFN